MFIYFYKHLLILIIIPAIFINIKIKKDILFIYLVLFTNITEAAEIKAYYTFNAYIFSLLRHISNIAENKARN